MASHRAQTTSLTSTLARSVRHASPYAARGIGATLRRSWHGARIAGRVTRHASWLTIRALAMLTLAATWIGLLLLLLTLSLAMGKGGNSLREAVSRDMITPLGEGARQALSARQGRPVTVTPATLRRRAHAPQSHGMRALKGLESSAARG